MTSGAKRRPFKKWFNDEFEHSKFSVRGLLLATKEKRFWFGFVPTFCIFGTLLNLLFAGLNSFNLIGTLGFPDGLKVIWDAFLQTFGLNRNFTDWLGIFLLALLQGLLIGLLVVVVKYSKKGADNSASVQNSGIVAILAVLGSGCPTCGTALLTPILTTLFGSGVALAGTVSAILTWLAILLALWTLKRLGYDAYVAIVTKNLPQKRDIIEKRSQDEKGN
ncbi:hypothetical protein IJ090_00210 [Candidatus Saccharibacteria bacterium]|nr:hypothetical protein [Candidatus Saccharibacteria bacterium]